MVKPGKAFRGQQLGRRPHGHRTTAVHQDGFVADCQGNFRVVRGHQDGRAVFPQVGEGLHQAVLVAQVQMRAGFVQQEHARFLRECARDKYQLPLTAAKLIYISASQFRNASPGKRLARGLFVFFPRRAKQRQVRRPPEQDVLQHGIGVRLAFSLRHQ